MQTINHHEKYEAQKSSVGLQRNEEEQETGLTRVCISLLGEARVWLEGNGQRVDVPIRSHRRQELLAYIATLAPERSRRVSSGRILMDVFEHIAPRADADNLRGLFQKHTQLLRKEINEVAQQAGLSKVRLFQHEKVDNSSTKWWLAEECQVVDLLTVQTLYSAMEAAQEQGAAGTADLQKTSDQLIRFYQSCEGDYLEKHLQADEFIDAEWIRIPFTEYREMYLQALWNAAILAHTASMQTTYAERQRYEYAQRAKILYKTYALHAPRQRNFDLNARKSRRQSERALRGCLRMCQWLMDAQMADGVYASYERLMAHEFPEWKPAVSTVEILRAVRQNTGQGLSLRNHLEPPEE